MNKIGIIILILGISVAQAQEEQGRPPLDQSDMTGLNAPITKSFSAFVTEANEDIDSCSASDKKEKRKFFGIYQFLQSKAEACHHSNPESSSDCTVETPAAKSGFKGILKAFSKKNNALNTAAISKDQFFSCLLTKNFSTRASKVIEDKMFIEYIVKKEKKSKKEAKEIRAFYRELIKAAKKE